MSVALASSGTGSLPGIDTLRLFALVLVTWQHAASVLGAYSETQWRGISPGQTGVAIFCALSAYLAFRTSPSSLSAWWQKRVLRLFPAYWIVTIAAFGLACGVQGRPFDPALFASQMLGLGYFTHGWELINVVSWFISLLLLCYGVASLAWLSRWPRTLLAIAVLLAAVLLATRLEVALSRHLIAFALGAMLAMTPQQWPLLLLGGVLGSIGVLLDPQFFYAGVALLLTAAATRSKPLAVPGASLLSRYTYEYFLLHGIFLAALAHILLPRLAVPWQQALSVVMGAVVLSMLAAVLLERVVAQLPALSRYLGKSA